MIADTKSQIWRQKFQNHLTIPSTDSWVVVLLFWSGCACTFRLSSCRKKCKVHPRPENNREFGRLCFWGANSNYNFCSQSYITFYQPEIPTCMWIPAYDSWSHPAPLKPRRLGAPSRRHPWTCWTLPTFQARNGALVRTKRCGNNRSWLNLDFFNG